MSEQPLVAEQEGRCSLCHEPYPKGALLAPSPWDDGPLGPCCSSPSADSGL